MSADAETIQRDYSFTTGESQLIYEGLSGIGQLVASTMRDRFLEVFEGSITDQDLMLTSLPAPTKKPQENYAKDMYLVYVGDPVPRVEGLTDLFGDKVKDLHANADLVNAVYTQQTHWSQLWKSVEELHHIGLLMDGVAEADLPAIRERQSVPLEPDNRSGYFRPAALLGRTAILYPPHHVEALLDEPLSQFDYAVGISPRGQKDIGDYHTA